MSGLVQKLKTHNRNISNITSIPIKRILQFSTQKEQLLPNNYHQDVVELENKIYFNEKCLTGLNTLVDLYKVNEFDYVIDWYRILL